MPVGPFHPLGAFVGRVAERQNNDEQRLGTDEDPGHPRVHVLLPVGEQQQWHGGLYEHGLDHRAGPLPQWCQRLPMERDRYEQHTAQHNVNRWQVAPTACGPGSVPATGTYPGPRGRSAT